jgi:hypothetical protein
LSELFDNYMQFFWGLIHQYKIRLSIWILRFFSCWRTTNTTNNHIEYNDTQNRRKKTLMIQIMTHRIVTRKLAVVCLVDNTILCMKQILKTLCRWSIVCPHSHGQLFRSNDTCLSSATPRNRILYSNLKLRQWSSTCEG